MDDRMDDRVENLNLLERVNKLMGLWWLPVLFAIAGGIAALMYHSVQPPVYEATAVFYASVDMTKTTHLSPDPALYQYDEDISLAIVQRALLEPSVTAAVLEGAQQQGIAIDLYTLNQNATIERRHAFWDLRFRSENARTALIITNIWAQAGYQQLLDWQNQGQMAAYVIIEPPIPAELPQEPTLFGRNRLLLAGGMIGFVVGLFTSNYLAAKTPVPKKIQSKASSEE